MNPALVVVLGAVCLALLPMPYGYYSAMRWVVCGACAYLAFTQHRSRPSGWTWAWVVVAGIYNPVVPVHADRSMWTAINLATIGLGAFYLAAGPKRR